MALEIIHLRDVVLEIAVRNAFLVRRSHRVGKRYGDVEELAHRESILGQKFAQDLPGCFLGGDSRLAHRGDQSVAFHRFRRLPGRSREASLATTYRALARPAVTPLWEGK